MCVEMLCEAQINSPESSMFSPQLPPKYSSLDFQAFTRGKPLDSSLPISIGSASLAHISCVLGTVLRSEPSFLRFFDYEQSPVLYAQNSRGFILHPLLFCVGGGFSPLPPLQRTVLRTLSVVQSALGGCGEQAPRTPSSAPRLG